MDNVADDDGTSCRARSFSNPDTRRTNLNQNNNREVIPSPLLWEGSIMSRIRKQYKFMCWWNFGGISPPTHIIFCWKVSILSKASSLPIHVRVLPETNTFPILYMNEGTGTEHFRSTLQKESQFLLLCCCWSSFTTLLHFIPSTKFTFVVGNYYLWVSFTIWGFIGSMSVGSWAVARLADSCAI